MKRVAAFALLVALSGSWAPPAQAQRMSVEQEQRQSAKDAKKQQKLQKKAAKQQAKAQKKAEKAQKKQLKAARKADAKANRQLHP
ncbi:MAG: hypothetical protein WB607_29975 [Candidatus Acidiferrum sp.]|jgi:hypothetical protein